MQAWYNERCNQCNGCCRSTRKAEVVTGAPGHDEVPSKKRAVLAGAFSVFAREVYTRASIDGIAAAAGVSTRTIYNHFRDKAALFQAVIQHSAAEVAAAQIAIMDHHLNAITDLEADLIAFGQAWLTPMTDYADHRALVRQVNAEAGHIPQPAIDAWQEAGPGRVRDELAGHFQRWAEQGLLEVDDTDRAALHFALLISTPDPAYRGTVRDEAQVAEAVAAGVHAFLHGYAAKLT